MAMESSTGLTVNIEDGVLRSSEKGMALMDALRLGLSQMKIIRTIEIRWKRLGDAFAKDICSFVRDAPQLTSIDLADNYIGDSGCKGIAVALATQTRIKHLNLSGNRIGDLGVATLSTMLITNSTLESLNLSGNTIQVIGMQALGGGLRVNRGLKELHLVENFFGDQGALEVGWALTYNTQLTSLSMKSNDIGNAGAAMLATGLQKNTTLRSLDLADNSISDRGAMQLSEALFANTTLRNLDVTLNDIEGEGKDALLDAIDFSFVCEPTPTSHRLAIAMALHPRLGEESPLWQIARPFLCGMKKTIKAGKKPTIREKTSFMDTERTSAPPEFPGLDSWEGEPVEADSPLRVALDFAILHSSRKIRFDGMSADAMDEVAPASTARKIPGDLRKPAK